MTIQAAVLILMTTVVTFGAGMLVGRFVVQPQEEVVCRGVLYMQDDGSLLCEPRMNCPKGPRGG